MEGRAEGRRVYYERERSILWRGEECTTKRPLWVAQEKSKSFRKLSCTITNIFHQSLLELLNLKPCGVEVNRHTVMQTTYVLFNGVLVTLQEYKEMIAEQQ